MTTVAVVGAGGKMGCRVTDNLLKTDYELLFVEPSEAGQSRLAERGVTVTTLDQAVAAADAIVLAVPDNLIGVVAQDAVPHMKSGATLIVLDAAAPFAGRLPKRGDVSYVACHPCHPSVFNRDETTREAQTDYFGGIAAKQDVVVALIQGNEEDYVRAERIVRAFFAPVVNSHRVTLENMILLEPVMAETTAATCVIIIKEAMDEAVRRGVPADAARAFILGHVGIELAIVFGELGSPFSDGALKAIEEAKPLLFKEDGKRGVDDDMIRATVDQIVNH